MLIVTDRWKQTYPGAVVGAMTLKQVTNPAQHPALEKRKQELLGQLQQRYAGLDRAGLKALPVLQAYRAYYDRFKKTYHVQLQLESVLLKGRPLPSVAALVEAMFIAELDHLLLTAGHDLDAIQGEITLDAASGDESYTLLNGQIETAKATDMLIRDQAGVISSIIYGPDQRTQITPATRNALFTVYAPPGLGPDLVRQHLEEIQAIIRLVSAQTSLGELEIITAE